MSIRDKVKQYGWENSLKLFLKGILRIVRIEFESYWLLENNLCSDEISQKMKDFDYSDVKELNLEDFKKGDPTIFNEVKLKLIEERFESGQYWSYGVFSGSELIYSCWITTLEIGFRKKYNTSIPLLEDEGYLEDAYTHPDYRGKGLHSKMNLFRIMSLIKKGKSRNYVLVLSENNPAMKSQLKSGFVKVEKMTFLILFGKHFFLKKHINDTNKN
ncbi:hypothetical protein [Lutimonas vermicola]|uniref:N-acetyltransferase domain-containing protein n=1 Tax=Lutimonas vermicola TaxID=414288 RepID=A0ABU9L422_9FLAO